MSIRNTLVLSLVPIFLLGNSTPDINSDKELAEVASRALEPTKLLSVRRGNNTFDCDYKNRTEAFYTRSVNLFSDSPLDQAFYAQTTNDISIVANIDDSALRSSISMRNKSRWGNPNSIAKTTSSSIKIANSVAGSHGHAIPRQILWLREAWVDLSFNKLFDVQASGTQNFRFGSFGFELGRGIALGSAYAVSPGILGFYNSNVIDQYASGILFSGDIVKNQLSYGLYLSMLENQSDKLDNNLFPSFSQEIGKRDKPWRGFGRINSIFASKLTWSIKNPVCTAGKLTVEPYAMVNSAPEQRVEFESDAKSLLGTVGLSCEYQADNIEWGFDVAANLGHQNVRSWDRNSIVIKSDNGVLTETYSNVFSDSAKTTNAVVTSANKAIVDASSQSFGDNGAEIGTSGLYNSDTRFRRGYKNKYNGFMFVADVASWVYKKEFKLAGTVAYVTGDENPNRVLSDPLASNVDGDYGGFIGLQEIYSGKRVRSVMVLGSAAVPRPLSSPFNSRIPRKDRFASNVSGFTNLVSMGMGAEWAPTEWAAKFKFKPNVLAYWQQTATKKFDKVAKLSIDEPANKFLGIEVNGFLTVDISKNLGAFVTMGLFVPGAHFRDIEGRPLSADHIAFLEEKDKTGYTGDVPPTLGTKRAVMINWGLTYSF